MQNDLIERLLDGCRQCGESDNGAIELFDIEAANELMDDASEAIVSLLSIARRWVALDAGAWAVDRHASEKAELLAATRALIAQFSETPTAAPSPSQGALREALATLGWNACRKSLYAVCEDVDREAEETCRKATDDGSSEYVKGHVEGYRAGMLRAAKSIARGFNAMEALDDDNLTAALAQSAPVKEGE